MEGITHQSVLDVLANGWGGYVSKFQDLSPEARSAFLEKQGYQRLGDLLAHVMAWWEVGLQAIENYKTDPQARQPEIEVDPFNAAAVEKARERTDRDLILAFEEMRRKCVALVGELSDADLQDTRIVNQLRMEFIGHLDDHKIQ